MEEQDVEEPRRFAMVCSANVNRSMAAHEALRRGGLPVRSFGTGTTVKIPGEHGQVTFEFGTPYSKMLEYVHERPWYEGKGMLPVLERNARIKEKPERWQDFGYVEELDVVICFADRVFHTVLEDLDARGAALSKMLHVVGYDVEDKPDKAEDAADVVLRLCQRIALCNNLDAEMAPLLASFERENSISLDYAAFLSFS